MKNYFFIIILFCWSVLAQATITMQIEPSSARPGETLRLTLTQHDNHSHETPDLSPLKTDFALMGTEHSMTYTANNGIAKSETQWVILLMPKKSGKLTIPAIKIGEQYSPPGQIDITTTPSLTNDAPQNEPLDDENNIVTLHSQIDQEKPFINQQVIYTVKLSTNQSLMEAQYQPPQVENALLIPLGNGRRYQTTIEGQEFSIDEQRYAIFPQKSGALTIVPPKLTAIVYDTLPDRIQVTGNTIQLIVKPKPVNAAATPWLPAKQITLSEELDSYSTTLQQGSTLVRKITLRAVGLPAELLPSLTFPDNDHYNVYPEKPETNNALRQQELIGTQQITVTYILNQPGPAQLPSIDIPWFNTQTGQNEIATLPSRHLTVTPKVGTPAPSPTTSQTVSNDKPSIKALPQPFLPVTVKSFDSLSWWIAAAFALAWVITLGLWWVFRNRRVRLKSGKQSARTRLRKVCAANDPKRALPALLKWGRQQWPNASILNLNDLGRLVHDIKLQQQINVLSQALYAQNSPSVWQGNALWDAIERYRPADAFRKAKSNPLPPINPSLDSFT